MWQNLHFYLSEVTENLNQRAALENKKGKKRGKEKREKAVTVRGKNFTIQIEIRSFSKNIASLKTNVEIYA